MQRFASTYKVERDGCWMHYITGRFGKRASRLAPEEYLAKIGPYDTEKGVLGIWVTGLPARMVGTRLAKLKPLLTYHDTCDDGFIGRFPEEALAEVCAVVGARKRRKASPAQLAALEKGRKAFQERDRKAA
jgi:hypothetical protein